MALPTACTNSDPPQDQINTGVEICGKIEIRFHCPCPSSAAWPEPKTPHTER